MKFAISIPDDSFERADRLARRLNISRSKLFARAMDEFAERQEHEDLTQSINAVLDDIGHRPDPFIREAGRRIFESLGPEDW